MNNVREHTRRLLEETTSLNDLTDAQRKDIEIGIYNWTLAFAEEKKIPKAWAAGRFKAAYQSKARSVLANLDPASYVGNPRLLQRLKDGEFLPHETAFMTPDNTFPERWSSLLDAKVRRDEYVFQEKPAAMTTQFRCGKCKKNECVYQELQLRSCDEPVTLFITCLNCGNRWRMG